MVVSGFPGGASGKEPARQCRRCRRCGVRSQSWENPLEEGMVAHSSILAWEIPWTASLVGFSPWGFRESDTIEYSTWLVVSGCLLGKEKRKKK